MAASAPASGQMTIRGMFMFLILLLLSVFGATFSYNLANEFAGLNDKKR